MEDLSAVSEDRDIKCFPVAAYIFFFYIRLKF